LALKLKLRETADFERVAGVPWMRAQKLLQVQRCKAHRLELEGCAECRAEGKPCAPHRAAVSECQQCEMPAAPVEVWAAVGWVLRKRHEPGLSYEEYIEVASFEDLMDELVAEGNAEGGPASAS
jgi:hypothetical protein